MPSTATDRLAGLTTSVAVKPPCVAVTSFNIPLTGLFTVSGVALEEDDRVLVRAQTDRTQNGVYNAATSDWTRALDFDGARDVVCGTIVLVRNAIADGALYEVTTPDPIVIGESAITFDLRDDPVVLYAQTQAEISAGVVPVIHSYPPIDARRYGYLSDNQTASAAANRIALNSAIAVAAANVGGASGATVILPVGIAYIDQTITLPNRVRVQGGNCSGSIVKAIPTFPITPQPYMFYAQNGTTALFDSILQDLFIDCSSVTGLGAVQSDAWQENDGLRSVGILNFKGYGIHLQHGYGGSSTCEIQQLQIFAPATGATAGIRVEQISIVGAFQLHVRDTGFGGPGVHGAFPRGIDMVNDSLLAENIHFEDCTDGIYLDGVGNHTIINCSGGLTTDTLIHIASSFTGRVTVISCQRNGASVLIKNDVTGETLTSPDVAMYVYPDVHTTNTCKAWGVFDGTVTGTHAPEGGFNVTSVQRTGAGRYTVTLTNPLLNAFYSPISSSNLGTTGKTQWDSVIGAASFTISINVAGVATDASEIHFVVYGP